MKLHQRAWAIERGVGVVTWTFDPLQRRNAYFNLTKLGARPVQYVENFYGDHGESPTEAPFPTDRIVVDWDISSPAVVAACAGRAAGPDQAWLRERGCQTVLEADDAGRPRTQLDSGAAVTLVGVPQDATALRRSDPGLALEWRALVKQHLADAFNDGAWITGFVKDGFYVLERSP